MQKRDIPTPVTETVEWLERHNAGGHEGIFRIPGSPSEIKFIKEQYNKKGTCDLEKTNACIESVASVLKLYLRDLPDPLFMYKYYSTFLKVRENPDPVSMYRNLRILVHKGLPDSHRKTLFYLLDFLHRLAQRSHENKMPSSNLAMVFAPNVLRPKTETIDEIMANTAKVINVLQLLIDEVDYIAMRTDQPRFLTQSVPSIIRTSSDRSIASTVAALLPPATASSASTSTTSSSATQFHSDNAPKEDSRTPTFKGRRAFHAGNILPGVDSASIPAGSLTTEEEAIMRHLELNFIKDRLRLDTLSPHELRAIADSAGKQGKTGRLLADSTTPVSAAGSVNPALVSSGGVGSDSSTTAITSLSSSAEDNSTASSAVASSADTKPANGAPVVIALPNGVRKGLSEDSSSENEASTSTAEDVSGSRESLFDDIERAPSGGSVVQNAAANDAKETSAPHAAANTPSQTESASS